MTPSFPPAAGANPFWKFFTSVRLTVVLLLSLALTSMIGTLIPQNQAAADYVSTYGEFWYRLLSVLNIFDMYHSWWFRVLLLMLAANVVVCSIDRLSATWRLIFPRSPKFSVRGFRRHSSARHFQDGRSPAALVDIWRPRVQRRFANVRVEPSDQGVCIFGEKWRWTRIGVYVVHLSVILLLVGGLIGSFFGFDGFVNIPEGESRDRIFLRNSPQSLKLDFEIRCNDFDVSFYENGAPKEYRSSLTLLEGGRVVFEKDIIVNDPLRYKGISIFQSSYGKLPGNEVTLSLTSRDTGMIYSRKAVIGRPITLPEDLGTLVIEGFQDAAQYMGHDIGPAFVGTITPPGAAPDRITLPLRFPSFDQMRKGQIVVAVAEADTRYYTGLQVAYDPGVWVVYTGFILLIAGCFITFFMSHQQVCVELVPAASGSRVMLAGKALKGQMAMEQKLNRLAEELREA